MTPPSSRLASREVEVEIYETLSCWEATALIWSTCWREQERWQRKSWKRYFLKRFPNDSHLKDRVWTAAKYILKVSAKFDCLYLHPTSWQAALLRCRLCFIFKFILSLVVVCLIIVAKYISIQFYFKLFFFKFQRRLLSCPPWCNSWW